MKKLKVFVLSILMVGVMAILSGCGESRTNVIMSEDGSGVVSYRIAVDKNSIEDTEFTNFNTIEELAAFIQSKIDPETNLKVTTDKISSDKEDYIVMSYEYKTIEEYNANVDTVLMKYNMLVVEEDTDAMFGYNPMENNKGNCEMDALKEYLEENNIVVDTTNRNVRKLVKIIKPYMNIEELEEYGEDISYEEIDNYEELRYETKDGEFVVIPNVEIVKSGDDVNLKINALALQYLDMYAKRIIQKYSGEIFNAEYIQIYSNTVKGNEVKEILKQTFKNIDLASKIKTSLDNKFNNTVTEYNMNDFSPVLAVKLFDENYSNTFTKEYCKEYNEYQAQKEEKNSNSEAIDLMTEIYKERDKAYEITFGANTVVLENDEIYEEKDETGRITVSNKGDINSNEKEVTNNGKDIEGIDESPFTGDTMQITALIAICILALNSMVVTVIRRVRR